MKKMWTISLAATVVAVFVAVSQMTWAGDGGDLHARLGRLLHGEGGDGKGIETHLDAAAVRLDLSASQRKEVAALLVAAVPGLETRALALVEAQGKQLERVHAPELDEEAIRAASARSAMAQGELAVSAARLLRDVHRVLTPEQRERLAHLPGPHFLGGFAEHVRGFGQGTRAWAARQ